MIVLLTFDCNWVNNSQNKAKQSKESQSVTQFLV